MFAFTSDSITCQYLRWEPHTSVNQAETFIEKAIRKIDAAAEINWGIYLKETGRLMGALRVYKIDTQNESADVSYILNRSFTGRGYMTECLSAVITAVGESLKLKNVYADFVEGNIASRRVMERCGMKPDIHSKPWDTEIKGQLLKTYRYVYHL